MAMTYDYTVFAGTQGFMNHKKMDRMFHLAEEQRLPSWSSPRAAAGGPVRRTIWASPVSTCRPSGCSQAIAAGRHHRHRLRPLLRRKCRHCRLLRCHHRHGKRQSRHGRSRHDRGRWPRGLFARGGRPGRRPGAERRHRHPCRRRGRGVPAAKRYLAISRAVDGVVRGRPGALRRAIPENRLRAYDVRAVIDLLCDEGSVLELRPRHGIGMMTALVRIAASRWASSPTIRVISAARSMRRPQRRARGSWISARPTACRSSPLRHPGFMVGPPAEETALVRRVSRMFLSGAALTVPLMTVVLRKGYGLGAQAMAAGSFQAPCSSSLAGPVSSAAWASKAPCASPTATNWLPSPTPANARRPIAGTSTRSTRRARPPAWPPSSKIDAVIDPAETRHWILRALASAAPAARPRGSAALRAAAVNGRVQRDPGFRLSPSTAITRGRYQAISHAGR